MRFALAATLLLTAVPDAHGLRARNHTQETCAATTREERCAAVLALAKKIEKEEPSKECKKIDENIEELDEASARCGGSQTCGPAVLDYIAKVKDVLLKQKAKRECPAPAAVAAFVNKPTENCAKTPKEQCAAVLAFAKNIEKEEPSKECTKINKNIEELDEASARCGGSQTCGPGVVDYIAKVKEILLKQKAKHECPA